MEAKPMNEEQAIAHVRKAIEKDGSQKAFASRVGISQAFLSDMMAGKRYLSSDVLAAVGLEKVVTYRKAK
jgi:DNA-binding transcriptional regulator YdaS (Cro superfamily)